MKGLFALSLVLAVALTGCSKPGPVVVLDSWWNVGFAKKTCATATEWMNNNRAFVAQIGCAKTKSCPEMTALFAACGPDPAAQARAFDAKFAAGFAADCPHVGFARLDDPSGKIDADASRRWRLMIDFVPGPQTQIWTLTGPSSQYARSSDTAEEIAGKVCAAVKG